MKPYLGGNEEGGHGWEDEKAPRGREKPAQARPEAEGGTTTRNEGFERHRPFSREVARARVYGIAYGCVLGFLAGLCAWGLWYALGHPATWAMREVR